MTITAADIKILASERMRDTADGGGHATAIALESGAENNMFPDVSDADRVWGYLRLRKVYAALVNAGTDTLLGAYAILEDMPDDPATTAWMMVSTGIEDDRAAALARFDYVPLDAYYGEQHFGTDAADRYVLEPVAGFPPAAGMFIYAHLPAAGYETVAMITSVVSLGGNRYRCTFDAWPSAWGSGIPANITYAHVIAPDHVQRVHSTLRISGTLSSGATAAAIAVSAGMPAPLVSQVVPKLPGVETIGDPEQMGLGSSLPSVWPGGVTPCVASGDMLVVHHTENTAPTSVIAGATIACGRTSLAAARVWGANGIEITTGFTVDLDAGTVQVVNPSGWSQPVYVRHRIEDVLGCASLDLHDPTRVNFNRPLARAFPAGTLLSSALPLGDMQAMVVSLFAQGTWTATWQDSRIGGPIAAQFDDVGHPIAVLNRDAITERWAIEFLTSTTYRLFGEASGEIATGSVNTDLAPLNPATGHPYFTLAATGWSDGWAAGNVLRFNTVGASVPIWVARVVLPSAPGGGADSLTLAIKGNIDA